MVFALRVTQTAACKAGLESRGEKSDTSAGVLGQMASRLTPTTVDHSMAAIYPDLEGKSVLVTGGGSGIGASIVRAFARQKAKVGFLDIAREPSVRLADELTSQGFSVHYEYCDLTNIDHLREAIGRVRTSIGPVRVLVNNAAHDDRHTTESVTPEYWDNRIAVNLKHQFFAAQAVLPDMQAAQDGAIVNFGSISWMTGQGRDAGLHRFEIGNSWIDALARARLRRLEYPRQFDRAGVDHDGASG